MPKLVDRKAIERCILSQQNVFTPDQIALENEVSAGYAYTLIKEMVEAGHVVLDHKQGRRMFYSAGGKKGGKAVHATLVENKDGIMSLSPAERFKYVGDCADMVIGGFTPSVMIGGVSGIGKSFLVRQRLKQANKRPGHDYKMVTGCATDMGLYRLLYENRDSVLVFDDCDDVFKTPKAINILKAAMDSYDTRLVCWHSERMPDDLEPEFEFEGQIIFVTNIEAFKIDEAIKSRTIVIDLQMSRPEICEYLVSLSGIIEPKVPEALKGEVLAYLKDKCEVFDQFNIRTFIKAIRMRLAAELNGSDWRKMILVTK